MRPRQNQSDKVVRLVTMPSTHPRETPIGRPMADCQSALKVRQGGAREDQSF